MALHPTWGHPQGRAWADEALPHTGPTQASGEGPLCPQYSLPHCSDRSRRAPVGYRGDSLPAAPSHGSCRCTGWEGCPCPQPAPLSWVGSGLNPPGACDQGLWVWKHLVVLGALEPAKSGALWTVNGPGRACLPCSWLGWAGLKKGAPQDSPRSGSHVARDRPGSGPGELGDCSLTLWAGGSPCCLPRPAPLLPLPIYLSCAQERHGVEGHQLAGH